MRLIIAVTLLALLAGCAGNIVEYPENRAMTPKEIKEALMGSDFRAKTAAREQLDKLAPEVRLEVLGDLLKAPDAPTRMMAVMELSKFPLETSRPLLEPVAASDADEEVRELAAMVLDPSAMDDSNDEEDGAEEEAE